jgi:hypothetical protein
MPPSSLFRLLVLSLVVTLSACTNLSTSVPPAPPGQPWPPKPFTTVRAFVYDCHADESYDFVQPGGRLAKGILNAPGTLLTETQVRRLMAATSASLPKSTRSPCYVPHHAFVFYDAQGRAVAHLEICFTCNKHRAFPAGTPDYIDMVALQGILDDAGVIRGAGKNFYRDIYKQKFGQD